MRTYKLKSVFITIIILAALLQLIFAAGSLYGQTNTIDDFYTTDIEGIIDPALANQVKKSITQATQDGYALILQIDTPGGLEASMRDIIKEMLNASIPIIVYIQPEGARAASAGVFITYASDIAAMHPGTNIGAAHPVNLGGEQASEEMMEKITNDSVAYIKNLAESKGRNTQWAEKAVRESVSITAGQALDLGVIDFTTESLDELLAKINGLEIEKNGRAIIFSTDQANVEEIEVSFITKFLHIISNPNIAYILFILGLFGIIYEFSQPGLGISGALGVFFIILGLYSFSILPINYAGLGLIVLAIILFILDVALGLSGVLSLAGIASMLIGSFILIDTQAPYLRIAKGLIIGASIAVSIFIIIVIRAVYKVHRKKPVTGETGIIGKEAIVIIMLKPVGQVKVNGEIWKAVSTGNKKIKKGRKVIVENVEGLTLYVKEKGG
ncbi:MAG: nodulation protein NfeD [Candidatus Humimicrobiaceae bacterium]